MSAADGAREGVREGPGGAAGGGGLLNRFVQLPGRPRSAGEWRPVPGRGDPVPKTPGCRGPAYPRPHRPEGTDTPQSQVGGVTPVPGTLEGGAGVAHGAGKRGVTPSPRPGDGVGRAEMSPSQRPGDVGAHSRGWGRSPLSERS